MVNVILLCPVTGTVVCVFTPHTACRSAAPMAGKVTHVNYTLFPTAPRILGSRHNFFVFFYLGLLTTDVARSGQRQVPFLNHT